MAFGQESELKMKYQIQLLLEYPIESEHKKDRKVYEILINKKNKISPACTINTAPSICKLQFHNINFQHFIFVLKSTLYFMNSSFLLKLVKVKICSGIDTNK